MIRYYKILIIHYLYTGKEDANISAKIGSAIVNAFTGFGEQASVCAKFDDGSEARPLFKYFDDEISFTEEDFIGKTKKEALELRDQRDKAYLQS